MRATLLALLIARARAAGDEVEILKLSGASHFDPIAPGAPA
jgi:hypothetical protein